MTLLLFQTVDVKGAYTGTLAISVDTSRNKNPSKNKDGFTNAGGKVDELPNDQCLNATAMVRGFIPVSKPLTSLRLMLSFEGPRVGFQQETEYGNCIGGPYGWSRSAEESESSEGKLCEQGIDPRYVG